MNQEDQEGSRKGSPQVQLFRSYARSNCFWFFKFSKASEQQRIKHSQRLKLFTTIQFIPQKGCAVFPRKLSNFVILPAAHKQGFPRWPWRWPFIWSPWSMVLTPDMLLLHCMSSRWGIYPGEEWILDSGFRSLVGFRILSAGFRIPKPRIPDSTSKKFRIPTEK